MELSVICKAKPDTVTLLSECDYDKYKDTKLYLNQGHVVVNTGTTGKQKWTPLVRLLLNPAAPGYVKHSDGNPLNNQRENLSFAKKPEKKPRKPGKGIRKTKDGRFEAILLLGRFATEEEAIEERKRILTILENDL